MTRTMTILGLSALLPMLAATAAAAQSQTGTGGGPTSTVTAPHTSPVGRTMPPASVTPVTSASSDVTCR